MTKVGDICEWMNQVAPLRLSEPWDNTGLLLGDPSRSVRRLQTCLTLTAQSVSEAVDRQADMVIAHHPMPFKPITSITTESTQGRLLWQMARAGICLYSPHTAWDSAESGINAMLASRLKLQDVRPLVPARHEDLPNLATANLATGNLATANLGTANLGSGRIGTLTEAMSVRELAQLARKLFPESRTRGVDSGRKAQKIAVACGSGGSLLGVAIRAKCDLFLTGEATFHNCLEAQAAGISMLMIGHFASERFAMVELALRLNAHFPGLMSWPSQLENDPVEQFA